MRIDCPLHGAAIATPQAVAIRDELRAVTYAHCDALLGELGSALASQGVGAGDYVGILAQNSIEYIAVLFALSRLGAVAVPLNFRLSTRELQRQTSLLDIKLALSDSERRTMAEALFPRGFDLQALTQQSRSAAVSQSSTKLDLEAEFCVVFTSGSSGNPKAVLLTLGNVISNARGSNANLSLTPADTWHLSLPLFHVGGIGIVFRSVLAGSQVYITGNFDSTVVNDLIDRGEVTHLSLVPTMLRRLLDARNNRPFPRSLRAVLLGGAPVPVNLREQIVSLQIPAITSYGLTETASQVSATAPGDTSDKLMTSGRALPFAKLRIDATSTDGCGEILVKGEIVCRRVLGEKSEPTDSEGWLRTGDIGSLDAQGYLTVLGRQDDMIISGGENIFPQEIVDIVEQFSEIAAAAVMAVTDEVWGTRPLLFVELRPGKSLDESELRQRMSADLARYKIPERIKLVREMPRTALGKIDRQALAKLAEGC